MRIRSIIIISMSAVVFGVASIAAAGQRVFVSSVPVNGDLGGLAGADAKCQDLAHTAGLGGVWTAWLSDSSTNARDRINGNGPFVRVDGIQIASDREDLLDGSLEYPIILDEYGDPAQQSTVVTGTLASGYRYNGGYTFCNDWRSSESNFTPVGLADITSSGWSFAGPGNCNHPMLLYCFEFHLEPIFAGDFETGDLSRWSSSQGSAP